MKKIFTAVFCGLIALIMCACGAAAESGLPQGFEEHIVSNLVEGAAEIDMSGFDITPDEITDMYFEVLYDHPELFYVESYVNYSYMEGGDVTSITPSYLYTGEDMLQKQSEFDSRIAEIVAYASSAPTTLGKLMRVNEYFCVNFEYDESYTVNDPYGLLTGGTGVCEAYSLAFGAVMNELGIPNEYVSSDAMNHSWNMVQLDGEWYHIDVTWNDPVSDIELRACHENFLRSDAGIGETGHYGWEAEYTADSTAYDNAFWKELKTPIIVDGGYFYFTTPKPDGNGDRFIRAWDSISGEFYDISAYNIYNSQNSYFYYDGYTALALHGSSLYYGSVDKLYRLESSGEIEMIYAVGDESRQIWSAWAEGDSIMLLVGADIEHDCEVISVPLN